LLFLGFTAFFKLRELSLKLAVYLFDLLESFHGFADFCLVTGLKFVKRDLVLLSHTLKFFRQVSVDFGIWELLA
jgi:hypothetical protein